jgi:hypothetical protein
MSRREQHVAARTGPSTGGRNLLETVIIGDRRQRRGRWDAIAAWPILFWRPTISGGDMRASPALPPLPTISGLLPLRSAAMIAAPSYVRWEHRCVAVGALQRSGDCFRWAAIGSWFKNAPVRLQQKALVRSCSPCAKCKD